MTMWSGIYPFRSVQLKAIEVLLWLLRTLNFALTYCDSAVMSYVWFKDEASGKITNWFESPAAVGERELYPICCVLRWDGFWFLVSKILTESEWLSAEWRERRRPYPDNSADYTIMSCACRREVKESI